MSVPIYRVDRSMSFTPETAEVALAIPVLYILAEQAQVLFPHSRRSSPSEIVRVVRKGDISGAVSGFPVSVSWDQWENAVLPVLTDEDLTVRAPMFKRAVEDGRIEEWVRLIGKKLNASFLTAGYGSS